MDAKQAKQLRINTMNIDALVGTVKAQGDMLGKLQKLVTTQAKAIITISNDLTESRKAMARATAAMGNGPTAR
jgi:hypothetical protein